MAKLYDPAADYPKRRQKTQKHASPARDAWRRFRRSKLAMTGVIILAIIVLLAVLIDVISPYDYAKQDYTQKLQGPSWQHIMGTDNYGRDIFTRVIYGARISLSVSLASVLIALVIGGLLGAIAGFYTGKTDNIIMRIMDCFQAIPSMLLAIAIASALGSGVGNLMIALVVSTLPVFARVVRAAVLTVRGKEYVDAARITGTSDIKIILKHMIPNSLGPIIVQTTFNVAGKIHVIAGLSYIGLGILSPTPEWGAMLNAGKQFLTSNFQMVFFPGIMIVISTFALNVIGDGLRDALDPKMKR